MILPPYATRDLVHERLPLIFLQGTPNRNYCIREMAASIVFVHLYMGAVEGLGVQLAPVHIYRMTYEQAAKSDDQNRLRYIADSGKRNFKVAGERWYEDNTREPLRDESLREGLVNIGAVLTLPGIPTTSSRPRYYLQKDFAALFNPAVVSGELSQQIISWQEKYLSKSALTRLSLAGLATSGKADILVTFPNKETRILSAGPSSPISKSVIEVFAPRFLRQPAVLWLSTSDDKVVARDDKIASSIGLKIDAGRNLPDIILVDLAPSDPILVFVEVVATDGAINFRRQEAIYGLTDSAGFNRSQVCFVTAYLDREGVGFTKTIRGLAWNSYAWFVSEPDNIIHFKENALRLAEK
jgi:hypothetical protein